MHNEAMILLDIFSADWLNGSNWLDVLTWMYEYWVWLGLAIFLIITGVVGYANHSLPSRDGIKGSHFILEDLGENNRLWRLLSRFRHDTDDIDATQQNTDAHQQDLTGIFPIDDGQEALNVRLLLTRIAESSLDLQYYMWHDDASGRLLFYEIYQAAQRGVRVRMLLDDNNTAGMDAVLQTLSRHPNIEIRLFNPFMNRTFRILGYLTAFKRLNRRMHNKSFTVDNQISVFGGRNIGDEYFDVNEKMNFADLDVAAIGKVVNDIAADFDRYWNCEASFPLERIITRTHPDVDLTQPHHKSYTTVTNTYRQQLAASDFLQQLEQGLLTFYWVEVEFVSDPPTKALPDTLLKQDYLPANQPALRSQKIIKNSDGSIIQSQLIKQAKVAEPNLIDKISDTLLSPKRSLTIVSPYFVPSGKWTQRFVNLAKQGIELNILTNSLTANDVLAVHAGYIRYRQALLQGGISLFELKSKRSHQAGFRKFYPTAANRHSRRSRYYRRQHRDRHRWLNRSTSSLHAKTFSIDGEMLFVGSFNFDPRSAAINTEMGAIIKSPILASQLDEMIEKWRQELSYVVSIDDNKLSWQDNSTAPTAIFTTEPESGFHQRMVVWLLGKLPIEDFL